MNKKRLQELALSLLSIVIAGACSGGGGCGGCGTEPIPGGALPSDQTIEGGAQLRISAQGFDTITDFIPAVLQDTLGQGTCIPEGTQAVRVLGVTVARIDYCDQNDGGCSPGCQVDFNVDSVGLSVPNNNQLSIDLQFDVDIDAPIDIDIFGIGVESCTLTASSNNNDISMLVDLGINAGSGELELELLSIPNLDIDINIGTQNCGAITDFLAEAVDAVLSGVTSILGVGFIRDLLTPILEPIIEGLLPDPLGFEGLANLGGFVGQVSPGTNATMEARIVPGGYANLVNNGLSLGIITGINADEDPATRSPAFDSEPALCVPPFPAPDFGSAPHNLSTNSRQNFTLAPADEFNGNPEVANDVVIGASETMLDQLGHHLVSSGAFCLSLGTELIPQMNLGAIGILVPSLAELGTVEGNDPLLLVTRPAKPIDFSIGDGTEASPSLTLHLSEFNIDFYAFLFERYIRGFTVTLDMNVGINLAFGTDPEGNPTVMPMLVGIDAANIGVRVLNEEFLREDRATLEAVFPSLLDLILPLVTAGLDSFPLPEIAGFQMENLSVDRVITSEDDFLAITAGLGAGSALQSLAIPYPSVAAILDEMQVAPPTPVEASAQLVDVIEPTPEQARAELARPGSGVAPAVVFDLATHDATGRELEWSWNIGGGMWRPMVRGGMVSISDRALFIPGKYTVEVRARAVGDARSWSNTIHRFDVVMDTVGPRMDMESFEKTEETLSVRAFDVVYENRVQYAFGSRDDKVPATNWQESGKLSLADAEALAKDGEIRVFVRDPEGNQSSEKLRISNALTASTGGCAAGGSQSGGLLALVVIAGFFALRRRRFDLQKASLVALLALPFFPACNCSGDPGAAVCSIDEDCTDCGENQIGQCFEGTCRCLSAVEFGSVGQFSAMDIDDAGTIWVSGYNSNHGDLMVAAVNEVGRIPNESWQFVDGVPDGPIVLPEDTTRGGIKAEGEDVGLYTDIAATATGAAVSYFDATNGSLKYASFNGEAWSNHVVDQGQLSPDDVNAMRVSGQYSSIAIDNNGLPAIAYFAHLNAGTNEARTEVRLATSSTANPVSAADWTINVIDEAEVTSSQAEENVLTIPVGTGLFIELIRDMNDEPVIAYYDRINGDLRIARAEDGVDGLAVSTLVSEGDVGWYPSIAIDPENVAHISFVDTTNQDLMYVNDRDLEVLLVDDGYRFVGTTDDGFPIPEFHFVGDDSSIVVNPDGVYISYQDATTHELLVAFPNNAGGWGRVTVAGNEDPFVGAYGFFAQSKLRGVELTMSTFVVDQPNSDSWVEIFRRALAVE